MLVRLDRRRRDSRRACRCRARPSPASRSAPARRPTISRSSPHKPNGCRTPAGARADADARRHRHRCGLRAGRSRARAAERLCHAAAHHPDRIDPPRVRDRREVAMADGRFDADRILEAANKLARRAVLFDMAAAAQSAAAPINAILFGALIGAGALPIRRATRARRRFAARKNPSRRTCAASRRASHWRARGDADAAPVPLPASGMRDNGRIRCSITIRTRCFPLQTHDVVEQGDAAPGRLPGRRLCRPVSCSGSRRSSPCDGAGARQRFHASRSETGAVAWRCGCATRTSSASPTSRPGPTGPSACARRRVRDRATSSRSPSS